MLSNKTPDVACQEFHGLTMAQCAVRRLMHEAALQAEEDPTRISLLHAVRTIRRKMASCGAIARTAEESIS
ncbi:MAG: hypothetical protein WB341_14420 [Terracidiphilus sp.]